MSEQLEFILKRINSIYLAELWAFFRGYFLTDAECLSYFVKAFAKEPEQPYEGLMIRMMDGESKTLLDFSGNKISEDVYVPHQMINAVMRFVLAARDMEAIRPGKDIFKLVYIITCVETLQTLGIRDKEYKKEMIISFFEENMQDEDKAIILKKFKRSQGDESFSGEESSIREFAAVLNEYRNAATHEGEYWHYCFTDFGEKYPLILTVNIDLEKFSRKNKKEHSFETRLSYQEFEHIFVRTCMRFIQKYVKEVLGSLS